MNKLQPMTKVILKTSAITFTAAFVIFSYGLFFFGLIFPSVMADISDRLGAHNAAGMYYERVYNSNKTPENMYLVLDRYIKAENYGKIIVFADKLLELPADGYELIIEKVNSAGRDSAQNKFDFISWANEDNRIKTWYTLAMLEKGKNSEALINLQAWLSAEPDLEQPNHAYFAFVVQGIENAEALHCFKDYVDRFDTAFLLLYGTQFAAGDHVNFPIKGIFAVDFLRLAHSYLGNSEKAQEYAEFFNGL